MTFQRLEELAKENALECKHIGCRFHMSADLSARMMKRYAPELGDKDITRLRDVVFGAPLLYQLMGIPIINDVGVTDPTEWILVDPTGEEIERGNVPYTSCDEYGSCLFFRSCTNYNNCAEVERDADTPKSSTDTASGTSTK